MTKKLLFPVRTGKCRRRAAAHKPRLAIPTVVPSQNLGRPRNASALHRFLCVTESTVDEEKCQRKSPASLKIKDKEV